MYAKQGRIGEAIASWEKVLNYIKRAEQRSMVQFNIARAYEKMGDPVEAIKYYTQSVETNPEQFNALSNIGSIYLRQNRPREAVEYLMKAYDKNPTDYITVSNLAVCFETLGNQKDAKTLREILKRLKR